MPRRFASRRQSLPGVVAYGLIVVLDQEWTVEQQRLAALVYDAWRTSLRWPEYRYVARQMKLRHGVDAQQVLTSYPLLGEVGMGLAWYGPVDFDRFWPANPDGVICLTVAGLARAARKDQDPAGIFLDLLRYAGGVLCSAPAEPDSCQAVTITDQSFAATGEVDPQVARAMADLIRREPSAVTGLSLRSQSTADGSWTAEVDLSALDHTHSTTVTHYLTLVTHHFTAPNPTTLGTATPREPEYRTPISEIRAPGARGVQIGDSTTQINHYYA